MVKKPEVQAMPASELANSPTKAKEIPGVQGIVLAGNPGMTL